MQQIDQSKITQEDNPNDLSREPIRKKSLQSENQGHIQLKKAKTRNTIIEQHENEDLIFEKIKASRFKQQRLPAWRPVPTIKSIFIIFVSFGIIFIIFGIILFEYSKKIKTFEYDYTDCNQDENNTCVINETIKETINKPVFIYYQLDGFFQNSRRYVKSKNIDQLRGKNDKTDDCDNFETNEKMELIEQLSLTGEKLVSNQTAIPCGLIAKTFFNDTFSFQINEESISVDENDISFAKDREYYKNNKEYENIQWTDLTNEHFIVWMRPYGLPDPRKLWGKIDRDLNKGDNIIISIKYNYNVSSYHGRKKIILSNVTPFGGNNTFLAICYLVSGCLSILCSLIFLLGNKIKMAKEKES